MIFVQIFWHFFGIFFDVTYQTQVSKWSKYFNSQVILWLGFIYSNNKVQWKIRVIFVISFLLTRYSRKSLTLKHYPILRKYTHDAYIYVLIAFLIEDESAKLCDTIFSIFPLFSEENAGSTRFKIISVHSSYHTVGLFRAAYYCSC